MKRMRQKQSSEIVFNKIVALALTGIVFSFSLKAQDSLSFRNCIEIGLERNYSLMMVRNMEQMTRNNYQYGIMNMMPTLGATGTATNSVIDSRQQLFSGDIRERDNAKSNSLNANIALNWTIFDGFGMFVRYRQLNEVLEMGKLTTRSGSGSSFCKYRNGILQSSATIETFEDFAICYGAFKGKAPYHRRKIPHRIAVEA